MQAIKNFGDYAVRATEATADDEYQRDMLHKANTVAVEASPVILALVFAILAWVLDGTYSVYAVLAILPLTAAQAISLMWLRNYAPRPRPRRFFTTRNIPFFILWAVGMAGIAYNTFGLDGGGASGMIIGGVAGAVTVAVLAPKIVMRKRLQDSRRLDQQLED
ncbi:hypothetical protein [Corynebacterium sp.]|uniref:hypothetical protein n=1 Tax=Corynebacterium sp. TaxID=1720 RepID=UPI002A9090E5|nr:hypothetical protein [Corynebacterium sp.]MDY5786113.1 hypothetical protein [Corynebacterium sp.]